MSSVCLFEICQFEDDYTDQLGEIMRKKRFLYNLLSTEWVLNFVLNPAPPIHERIHVGILISFTNNNQLTRESSGEKLLLWLLLKCIIIIISLG